MVKTKQLLLQLVCSVALVVPTALHAAYGPAAYEMTPLRYRSLKAEFEKKGTTDARKAEIIATMKNAQPKTSHHTDKKSAEEAKKFAQREEEKMAKRGTIAPAPAPAPVRPAPVVVPPAPERGVRPLPTPVHREMGEVLREREAKRKTAEAPAAGEIPAAPPLEEPIPGVTPREEEAVAGEIPAAPELREEEIEALAVPEEEEEVAGVPAAPELEPGFIPGVAAGGAAKKEAAAKGAAAAPAGETLQQKVAREMAERRKRIAGEEESEAGEPVEEEPFE